MDSDHGYTLIWNNVIVGGDLPVNVSWETAMIHTSLALPTLLCACNYLAFTASVTNNCGCAIGLAMPDQIENHWCGDNEDCKDADLHARMPAILNTHEFKVTCNRVARLQSFLQLAIDMCTCKI